MAYQSQPDHADRASHVLLQHSAGDEQIVSSGLVAPEQYVNYRHSPTANTVGELFGTENFCHFLYSLVRMDRPTVVVELGCGGAATALMVGKALHENAHGHCWTVDNGSDWAIESVRRTCQIPFGKFDGNETYAAFVRRLLETFRFSDVATLVEMDLDGSNFFAPDGSIDMLFADATPSNVGGCLSLLKYYLPRVSPFSSIFIDRAGTINHAFLFLKYVIGQLNNGKIPWHLLEGLDDERRCALERLVRTCEFQFINLTESKHGKRNTLQNSRAWIKIQPVDYLPHNDVVSFGSITGPWEME
jgi:predicted O-methyltransferase YrrM